MKCAAGVRDSWRYLVLLRPFPAERFIPSTYTQKMFDRAFKELSIGIRWHLIWLKIKSITAENEATLPANRIKLSAVRSKYQRNRAGRHTDTLSIIILSSKDRFPQPPGPGSLVLINRWKCRCFFFFKKCNERKRPFRHFLGRWSLAGHLVTWLWSTTIHFEVCNLTSSVGVICAFLPIFSNFF